MENRITLNDRLIRRFCLWTSIGLLLAAAAACTIYGEWNVVLPQLLHIITSPAKLLTDYYSLGGLGCALLNAGLCGLAVWFVLCLMHNAITTSSVLAGYFLVIAHGFYGLNILNIWPCFFGVLLYAKVRKQSFAALLPIALFATSLAPFISELLFRYTTPDTFDPTAPQTTVLGIVLSVLFAAGTGFLVPPMIPGVRAMHKGYNLYNAGITISLLAFLLKCLFYPTMGFSVPDALKGDNAVYLENGGAFNTFSIVAFTIFFAACIFYGWRLNGYSFRGYGALLASNGHNDDFADAYGMPLCLINLGFHGFSVLAYMALMIAFTDGAGFTGPTCGALLAALSFFAIGQHPRIVWPIFVGYGLLFAFAQVTGGIGGFDPGWTLSTQAYLNGLAFATGLCPIAGRFGWKSGVLAGAACAAMCSSSSVIHGGFCLYNGGFTAGITCFILVPILEHYVKAKDKASV